MQSRQAEKYHQSAKRKCQSQEIYSENWRPLLHQRERKKKCAEADAQQHAVRQTASQQADLECHDRGGDKTNDPRTEELRFAVADQTSRNKVWDGTIAVQHDWPALRHGIRC